tara:strand:+ start:6259 stop:7608 length:1350 start_codon:yes stop_codon:yes gene_type:complete
MSASVGPRIKSTPLRLTGQLIGIFTLAMIGCFGASYLVARQTIEAGLRDEIVQTETSLKDAVTQADFEDRFTHLAEATPRRVMLIEWRAADGRTFGNATGLPLSPTFARVGEDALTGDDPTAADSYLVRSTPLWDGQLILARSREPIIELGETFGAVVLVGLIPSLLLSAILGIWVARRTEDRIEAIRRTLLSMQRGDLSARVPTQDRDDDLARIAWSVNAMGDEMSAAMDSLRQVSTDIAHDLRTPIQRVQVLLDRMGETGLPGAQEALVSEAKAETDRITRTFRSMLQIARIEGGGLVASFEEVDLNNIAETMVSVYEAAAEDAGQVLTLHPASSPAIIRGDRSLLQQVLANLFENAIRHCPAQSRISVAIDASGPVVLTVTDDGPGIPEGEREKVLRRLYRLERSRTTEGSGLGLSLVAAACNLHGADLALGDARPGLSVTIRFPS